MTAALSADRWRRGPRRIPFARDAETKRNRQRGNSAGAAFLNTGQPALRCLRFIAAREIAGAMLTNAARLMELAAVRRVWKQSLGTKRRKVQLSSQRGNLGIIKDELVRINRYRLHRRTADQRAG